MREARMTIGRAVAVMLVAAACSPTADVTEPVAQAPPSVATTTTAASRTDSGTPSSAPIPVPTPTIALDPVKADWTRAIEDAIGGRDVSVAVGADDRIRFVHAGATQRIPASNQKLLTSMAALDTFGPDHRFITTSRPRGTGRRAATIRGDLWVVGSGDPEIDAGSMARLAAAVRSGRHLSDRGRRDRRHLGVHPGLVGAGLGAGTLPQLRHPDDRARVRRERRERARRRRRPPPL